MDRGSVPGFRGLGGPTRKRSENRLRERLDRSDVSQTWARNRTGNLLALWLAWIGYSYPMAVFLAAGDESDGALQDGPFIYGGWVAPVHVWTDWFAPAWEERVLNGPPAIPHLHMADIRSPDWRARHGLTEHDAEERVEEAARIVRSTGALMPVKTEFDGGHFRKVFADTKVLKDGPQFGAFRFEPDYFAFLGFVYASLDYVATRYPDSKRVDFVVERKTTVSTNIPAFYKNVEEGLRRKGRSDLVHLLGEVLPGGKDRIPLQAADVAVWHLRRHSTRTADRYDERRLWRMFSRREQMTNGLTIEELTSFAQSSVDNAVPNPRPKKAGTKHTGSSPVT